VYTEEERKKLLEIARKAIDRYFTESDEDLLGESTPAMKQERGAFVTLHKHGQLRGCIGYIQALMPLDQTVAELAVKSAMEDPRFPPLKKSELDQIDIEISAMTPLELIDDTDKITVGEHGLYIKKGYSSGLLLPQVATRYKWDRKTFLAQTCLKAGLPEDAWKDPTAEIYIFSAEIFGEKGD